jgi:hypothetical protein
MRHCLAAILALFLLTGSAAAQIRVSGTDCRRLVEHKADASVAYTPGVDVNGRAVAPADLPGGAKVQVPDEFVIPIVFYLKRGFGAPGNPTTGVQAGQVTVKGNTAYYNGQSLTDESQEELARLCRDQLAKKR